MALPSEQEALGLNHLGLDQSLPATELAALAVQEHHLQNQVAVQLLHPWTVPRQEEVLQYQSAVQCVDVQEEFLGRAILSMATETMECCLVAR